MRRPVTTLPRAVSAFRGARRRPRSSGIYRGIELFARQTVGDSLWLQASYVYSTLRGNYDGGVNQGVRGQTWPGINGDFDYPAVWHNGYGTLALDRTNRFRFDGYWVTPWRLSVGPSGLRRDRRAAQPDGLVQRRSTGSSSSSSRGARPGACRRSGEPNLTLSYPIAIGPTTVTLQAYLFNVFNKQIAVDARQLLVHLPARRDFRRRSTTRTRSRPTRSTGRSPAARNRGSSASPCAYRSDRIRPR